MQFLEIINPPDPPLLTGGTNTAYTITPTVPAVDYSAGQSWIVKFNAACGGSPTLAVSGLPLPPSLVKRNSDGTLSNLQANNIPANWISRVTLASTSQAIVESLPIVLDNSENGFVNGEMIVDQSGNVAPVTIPLATITSGVPSAAVFPVDRWLAYCTGSASTAQQVSGQGEFRKMLQINGAASTTGQYVEQRIISEIAAQYTNKDVTVTAHLFNSLLGVMNWTAYSANTTDNFSALTQIASGTINLSATDTTIRPYSFTFNAGPNAAKGIKIVFSVGAQISGSWAITGVDKLPGSYSRPYPHIKTDLEKCKYYRRNLSIATGYYMSGQAAASGVADFTIPDVVMRSVPSASANGTITDSYTSSAITGVLNVGMGSNGSIWLRLSCGALGQGRAVLAGGSLSLVSEV